MIHITRKEGQALNKLDSSLVSTTSHKRHYYAVECAKTYKLLEQIRKDGAAKKVS